MSDRLYQFIGMGTVFLIAFALVVAVFVFALWLAAAYWPRLHVGSPRNPLHWICYESSTVATAKGGGELRNSKPQMLHDYDVRWWVGLSCRHKPRWWFGFLKLADTRKD